MTINKRPATVYVIDDEPLDNMIVKMLIKRVDTAINVNTLSNGRKAIEQLAMVLQTSPESLPDYIFLDINMPGMDGWQFLKAYAALKIRKVKAIPIYIISSSIDSKDINRSKSNPLVADFMNKPLNVENLRTIFTAA
ncbi:response regulator transcription factor [Mucilaginibacter lutimaris]|uniref:Response regulator transcription factor n=1 Tax=Mucilaginibacter lutimaris TaxID=931629 RepID=A0ABW2ZL47_9SPHI